MKFLLILFVAISLSACGEYGVEPNQVPPVTEHIFADNLDAEAEAARIETQSYWEHEQQLTLKKDFLGDQWFLNQVKPIYGMLQE